jgi:hypothetical protein
MILEAKGRSSALPPVSAMIQDALRLAKRATLKSGFYQVQNYWSRKAKEKGIITERDLERYLKP